MSAGGFKFAKVTITGNSASYSTVFSWCLAVHAARCEAFLRATERENGHWTPIQTSLTGEGMTRVSYDDSNVTSVYYAQIAPSTSYPAFISYFRDTDSSAEYAILTAAGMSWSSGSTTCVYINPSRLNAMSLYNNMYMLAPSFAHAMAMDGFDSYDVTDATAANCEIPFTSQYGNATDVSSGQDSAAYSHIYNYSSHDGAAYTFGFSVKEQVIESFYHYEGGSVGWSIIGKIFNDDCIGGNPYGVLCQTMDRPHDSISYTTIERIDTWQGLLTVCDKDGKFYPSKTVHDYPNFKPLSRNLPSYTCTRAGTGLPNNLYYGALCCSFYSTITATDTGLDEYANLQKGYINTDILRVIAPQLCYSAGGLFQGGNFVTPGYGGVGKNRMGILLGWDASNDSLM